MNDISTILDSKFLNNPNEILPKRVIIDQGESELHFSLISIVKDLIPIWSEADHNEILVNCLTGGITNLLYVLKWKDRAVVVRLFGNGTEAFIDRSIENIVFSELSRRKLAPTFYGLFLGGRVEGYLDARPLEPSEMGLDSIYPKLALMVAQLHNVNIQGINSESCIWNKINKFFELDSSIDFSANEQKLLAFNALNLSLMLDQLNLLQESLKTKEKKSNQVYASNNSTPYSEDFLNLFGQKLALEVVFSHNDLLSGNLLFQTKASKQIPVREYGDITIIDYEYAGYNPRAWDLGNHFSEYAGFDLDYEKYFPKDKVRFEFIKTYLNKVFELMNDSEETFMIYKSVEENELEIIFKAFDQIVLHFVLVSHLMWGSWSVLQADISSIDFDFIGYAGKRFKCYFYHKKLFNIQF